jgi:DNA transposition AAA+ family ATPase
MAISYARRKALLARGDLPASAKVRELTKDYIERSGMSPAEFGLRISYSPESIYKFLRNTYADVAGTDAPLRSAVLDFIGAHPLDAEDGDAKGRLYETENVRLLRKYFHAALESGFAYYVDGGPGSQKTFVLQHLIAELNRREINDGTGKRAYYVYCRPEMTPKALLKRIAAACAVSGIGDIDHVIRNLRFEFAKRRVIICLDEAQHLERSIASLETIRELLDRPPYFGLLFAGSHGLRDMFEKRALLLEQWTSRLRAGKSLPGIHRSEAETIIRSELGAIVSRPQIDRLIKQSTTRDLRAGAEHTYISARRLFWSLREIKQRASAEGARQ